MKKTTLKNLLYQQLDSFEIVNVSYTEHSNRFEFLLREFELVDDKIKYLTSFKKLIFLDKFGFCYYEDGIFHDCFEEQIDRIVLEDELLSYKNFKFSQLQKDWIKILKKLDEFNEKEFENHILTEIKKRTENINSK